ncbi:MAG: CpcT/CpeT family chromophore lyase [Sumerlaeia bacterium]
MHHKLAVLITLTILLFSVTLNAQQNTTENATANAEEVNYSAELDALIESLTGTFTSQKGITGNTEVIYVTRLPEFSRAVYIEIHTQKGDDESGESESQATDSIVYQAVWKLHQVNNEMRWQFWEITTPEKFVGIHQDEKLRDELWMYQLRELDCCEMKVVEASGTYTARTLHDCCILGEGENKSPVPSILNITANKNGFVLESNHTGISTSARFVKSN